MGICPAASLASIRGDAAAAAPIGQESLKPPAVAIIVLSVLPGIMAMLGNKRAAPNRRK